MSVADFRKLVLALRHDQSLPFNSDGWFMIADIRQKPCFRYFDEAYVKCLDDFMDNPRIEVSLDGSAVRATSGHSVHISDETLLTPITDASEVLYCVHGTTTGALRDIKRYGIHRMGRHYVHFASHPDDVRCDSEVLIHLDVAKYLRRNPTYLFSTRSNNIVALGNKDGYVRPCFFKFIEQHPTS